MVGNFSEAAIIELQAHNNNIVVINNPNTPKSIDLCLFRFTLCHDNIIK